MCLQKKLSRLKLSRLLKRFNILLVLTISPLTLASVTQGSDEIQNTAIHVEMGVDYNRDGVIEFASDDNPFKPTFDKLTLGEPYVFWINDDDDKHNSETDGNDTPGTRSSFWGIDWIGEYNYENNKIDGTRDLIDFFPVAINFHHFFNYVPDAQDYTFRLKQEDQAVNIVFTEMISAEVDGFLRSINVNGDSNNLALIFGDWQETSALDKVPVHHIESEGIDLPSDFIDFIKTNNNQGVLLVEGSKTTKQPLLLEIINKKNQVILTVKLPLKLVEVEDMYAQVNIRGLVVKDGESASNDTTSLRTKLQDDQKAIIDNKNVPKSFDPTKQFVFLHGYKVTAEKARAWHAEMFKRLFQSGSNAMYVGFSWDSDEGVWLSDGLFNYWGNVENAFNSARIVSDIVNNSLSGNITIAAHSLGNIVLGQAIQQYGLRANQYFMLNPAVPTEAYNGTQLAEAGDPEQNLMAIPDWRDYYDADNTNNPRRLWASDWYRLFSDNHEDQRQQLTWRNLFVDVPNSTLYNFYSSGEEVLVHSTGAESTAWDPSLHGGQAAWITQEHQKGKRTLASGLSGAEAGWGFNCREGMWEWLPGFACPENSGLDSAEAFALTDAQLRTRPFAKPFLQNDLFSEDIAVSNAAVEDYKDHVLAVALPALSHAAGSTELSEDVVPIQNTDMNTQLKTVGWPAERGSEDVETNWRHSDAKDVSYRYVYRLYDTWVEKGNLNK